MTKIIDNSLEVIIDEHTDDYCCSEMKSLMKDRKFGICYKKQISETYVLCRGERGVTWTFSYCPFCGKDIEGKRELFFDTLKTECNIEATAFNENILLPEEFRTDEWWKKRGL
jgi:hypothetical protein